MGAQEGFDFAQLDAEAAQLHLEVGAAEVLQLAVGAPAHAVSGAVEAGAGSAAEGVRDEALGGERGAVQVAACHADAADEELAGHADGDGLEVGVEDEDAHVGQGLADGGLLAVGRARGHGGADGGFGGAVGVDEVTAGGPLAYQLGGAGLARGDDDAQRVQSLGWQGGEGGGRQGEDVDIVLLEQSGQGGAGLQCLVRGQAQRGAGEQRGNGFPDEGVEAGRGELEHARAGPQPLWLHLASREVGHAPVGHHDALGLAGAAGGVDDVCEPIGRGPRCKRSRRLAGQTRLQRVHGQPQHARRRLEVERRVRQQQRRAAILQHELQPFRGIGGVHGDEGPTGLEHGEHRHHPLGRARQAQRHASLRAHTIGTQQVRERVGASVELRVREHRGFEAHRLRIRRVPCLRLEQLVDAGAIGEGLGPAAPVHEHLPLLLGGQQRQLAQALAGGGDDALQQRAQVPQHAGDALGLEEVGAVHHRDAQSLLQFGEQQGHILLAGAAVDRLRLHAQPRQLQRRQGRVLEGERYLEQGRDARPPLGPERFHQRLEGHVLVGHGPEDTLVYAAEQREEGRVPGQVQRQGQGVDEQPDQPLELRAGAPGHRRAHDDVRLPAVAGQQHAVRGQQEREEGAALAAGQRPERVEQRQGQHHRLPRATRGGLRGPGPVRGQLQHRIRVQPVAPPGEPRFQHLSLEPAALPRRVIRVLHGQRRQGRRTPLGERRVERAQLPHQHSQGPRVRDEVVHVEQQQMLGGAHPVEHRPQQRPLLHVEGAARLVVQRAPHGVLGHLPQLHHREGGLRGGGDELVRLSVLLDEGGPQRLVPARHLVERPAQDVRVQRA